MQNDTVIYQCWTKATRNEQGAPRHSMNWVGSRRAYFIIYENRVACGDWIIPFDQIVQAKVYHTSQIFIPVDVLEFQTQDGSYQFGFNPWSKAINHLKIPIVQEKVKLGMSVVSILARIAILVGLYIIFKELLFR